MTLFGYTPLLLLQNYLLGALAWSFVLGLLDHTEKPVVYYFNVALWPVGAAYATGQVVRCVLRALLRAL